MRYAQTRLAVAYRMLPSQILQHFRFGTTICSMVFMMSSIILSSCTNNGLADGAVQFTALPPELQALKTSAERLSPPIRGTSWRLYGVSFGNDSIYMPVPQKRFSELTYQLLVYYGEEDTVSIAGGPDDVSGFLYEESTNRYRMTGGIIVSLRGWAVNSPYDAHLSKYDLSDAVRRNTPRFFHNKEFLRVVATGNSRGIILYFKQFYWRPGFGAAWYYPSELM
jgi:hypothetical protein